MNLKWELKVSLNALVFIPMLNSLMNLKWELKGVLVTVTPEPTSVADESQMRIESKSLVQDRLWKHKTMNLKWELKGSQGQLLQR